jgi:mycothiol synthase
VTATGTADLSPAEVEEVIELISLVTEVDTLSPLSEQAVLRLRHGSVEGTRHALVRDADGTLVGYGQLGFEASPGGVTAELVVRDTVRQKGIGTELLDALIDMSPESDIQLWAHGVNAASGQLARRRGFDKVRVLIQMRRSLLAPLPRPEAPAGVRIRNFRVGADEETWLALNAEIFKSLPDQASLTRADLERRLAEPWFDASGFFIAEDSSGAMVGFHWTKVHAPGTYRAGAIGEIYVLGVDQSAGIRGLGRFLAITGLQHLRRRGMSAAMLFVDEANRPAVKLYEGLGFSRWDTDVLYRRTVSPRPGL